MAKIVPVEQRPDDRFRVDCNCGDDGHSVVFELHRWAWADGEEEASLHVSDVFMTPRGWFGRIRAMWTIFWRGEYCRGEVGLNPEDLMAISAWCGKVLDEAGHVSRST